METLFWSRLDELIKSSEIVIDRPKGTPHRKLTAIGCTETEIKIIEKFHNGLYQSAIIIQREAA